MVKASPSFSKILDMPAEDGVRRSATLPSTSMMVIVVEVVVVVVVVLK